MSAQAILPDSRSATSSPALVSGLTHYVQQDGQMTFLFGPAVAHASLSARQALELGLRTQDTFGQLLPGSSSSAALQSSLESRLRAKLSSLGSTLYTLTWKPWNTPSGPSRFRLRASVRRTCETDFTGWPTVTATDSSNRTHCYSAGDRTKPVATLPGACRGMTWSGSNALTAKSGCVNPELACWLLAIPVNWISCAPTETLSTLKRRANSSLLTWRQDHDSQTVA